MLKTMRKNVKALKPTLWIIIATFVIAIFAIWGGAGRLGETNRSNTLATIGKERISSDAYFQTLRQRLEAMKKEYSQLNKAFIQQLNIPQRVLQEMVEQALLLQIAEDMKLGATDPEVRDRIISYPVFQKDGQFIGFKEYKQVLDWNRIPLADFEDGLKKEILIDKVVKLLTAGITVSDEEVWDNYKKQNESAKIEYLVAEKDKIELTDKPDAAAIEAHFEKNKAAYKVPEKRTADYLFFRTDDLKTRVKVDESEIEKYYKDNLSQFQDPEKIKVSRIFLPYTGKDKPQVLAQAADLLKRARAGEDFAELARTFSKDDKAKEGGDWGLTAWTALPAKETDEVAKMDAGKTSDVIETDTGAAILKVAEKTAAITRPLAEVKTTVKNILEDEKARELAADKASRIEKEARGQKSLDMAAQKEGLKVRSTGPLKQADPLEDFDPSGSISQTLFTLKDKEISAPIYTYTGVGIAQLQKTEPERPAKLEEVRNAVEKDILDSRKKEKALEKLTGVLAGLKDDWEDAAQKNGLQIKAVEAHKREQYLSLIGESPEVDNLAFSLPIKEPSRTIEVEGGYAVVRVLDRKLVTKEEFAKARDTERSTLLESQKSKFLQSYMVKARDEKKVKVNYDLYTQMSTEVMNRFSGE
ncbi:MAG: SurA N-terminal domain-containing protein [Candidatus Aminicenantes bacterium]|nr:SurA N-terminal domain-containing protein [Candidatus Aminicenantes bacterium]